MSQGSQHSGRGWGPRAAVIGQSKPALRALLDCSALWGEARGVSAFPWEQGLTCPQPWSKCPLWPSPAPSVLCWAVSTSLSLASVLIPPGPLVLHRPEARVVDGNMNPSVSISLISATQQSPRTPRQELVRLLFQLVWTGKASVEIQSAPQCTCLQVGTFSWASRANPHTRRKGVVGFSLAAPYPV